MPTHRVLPWFSTVKKEGEEVAVVGFWQRVAAAMGFLFNCFRIKDPHSHLSSTPERKISRNKNTMSSLFSSDEDSIRKGVEGRNPLLEEDVRELKDEAKFLKACGTLLQTPVEIRKASGRSADTLTQKERLPNFSSPGASIEKLKMEKQSEESPAPVKICEEWVTRSGSLMDSSSSCMTDGHKIRSDSINSIQGGDSQNVLSPTDVPDNGTLSPGAFATSVKCKNKSVRFEFESDTSTFSSDSSGQYSKQSESAGNFSVSKPSPYPTPLKLTDEMQTPGTVFPSYLKNTAGEKPNRIRSQYVYSVLNPIEYPSQWKELKDDSSDSSHLRDSLKTNGEATPELGTVIDEISAVKDSKNEASLSSWLKPGLANQDGNNEQVDSVSAENVHCGRTPGDRPILGMVAAHWNEDETSHISPKWWDGNGIPNSTTKYKEDQKVSFHATPFEERLEKALSEDTFIPQRPISKTSVVFCRKAMSGSPPVEFNETEESDTASSDMQSSGHITTIVSY